jgi:hypothetical protein
MTKITQENAVWVYSQALDGMYHSGGKHYYKQSLSSLRESAQFQGLSLDYHPTKGCGVTDVSNNQKVGHIEAGQWYSERILEVILKFKPIPVLGAGRLTSPKLAKQGKG